MAILIRKLKSIFTHIADKWAEKTLPNLKVASKRFLEQEGVLQYLGAGDEMEITPQYHDLANLYRLIRQRKPQTVVEFGVGFSTLTIAAALECNTREGHSGEVWVVDPEEHWLQNTKSKFPDHLLKYVHFFQSKVTAQEMGGQLCSFFEKLPDVVANFIYLDGPSSDSVLGEVRGLSFGNGEWIRGELQADALLYESFAPNDFFILVDGRARNVNFLIRNLKGKYIVKQDNVRKTTTFQYVGERSIGL